MKTRPVVTQSRAIHIQPRGRHQDELLRAIAKFPLVVAIGPAGVGKTWCAVQAAANLLASGDVDRIVLTRTNAPTGRTLGSFPGTVRDKLEPWLSPMTSVLKNRLGITNYESKVHAGTIEFYPLETIRGASFERTVVLVDEAQNLTYEEVKAITTRIGEGSRMILMGDPQQRDIRDSGLTRFETIVAHYGLPVPVVRFTVDDIVRSDIVGLLVRAFVDFEDNTPTQTP